LSLEDIQAKVVAEHRKGLEKLLTPWNRNIEIQTKVLIGTPFLELIREILHNRHDLVIKAADACDLLGQVFGSDDMHLLRKCPCPVWLVKSESPKTYHRILAAVDVDDYFPSEDLNIRRQLNLQILEMASSLALSEVAELHIVHAWQAIGEDAMRGIARIPEEKVALYVEETRRQHQQNLNILLDAVVNKLEPGALEYVNPQTHLLEGSPRKEIPAFAGKIEADIVVMGTVARAGIPGFFMGNTAETILCQLGCSILAVKPKGFVTPVTLVD
jgi:nucleotide-binding universal stress UspA family protein